MSSSLPRFLGVLGVAFAGLSGCQSAPHAGAESAGETPASVPESQAGTATLWVTGLACPFCVQNIDRQLAALPGVHAVEVDLPTGRVNVELSALAPATAEQLTAAMDESGFTLDRMEYPSP